MVENVRQPPFKGANETIVIALVIPAFTPVHVVLPEHHEVGIVRQMGEKVKREGEKAGTGDGGTRRWGDGGTRRKSPRVSASPHLPISPSAQLHVDSLKL